MTLTDICYVTQICLASYTVSVFKKIKNSSAAVYNSSS